MPDQKSRQWAIEGFLGRVDELKSVLGPASGARLERVRSQLVAALAERDKGDVPKAVMGVARAMADLAEIGDEIGAEEGAMMRALTGEFLKGLARGDDAWTEESLEKLQSKAGTPIKGEKR